MKNTIFLISIACMVLFSISCSDDTVTSNSKTDCKLISYTDSANYFYKVEYKNDLVSTINYFKFENNEVKDLLRRIEINRNLLDEVTNIVTYSSEGNINFIDSVYSNQNGLPFEIVTYNSRGEYLQKSVRKYNNLSQVTNEILYKYDETWVINSESFYLYDTEGRIIDKSYEQFLLDGSRKEHSVYKYDDKKNINKFVDIFSLFTTNNFEEITTTYTSRNGDETLVTKSYVYEYNDEDYPVKVESSSSSSENVSIRYNTIVCD